MNAAEAVKQPTVGKPWLAPLPEKWNPAKNHFSDYAT